MANFENPLGFIHLPNPYMYDPREQRDSPHEDLSNYRPVSPAAPSLATARSTPSPDAMSSKTVSPSPPMPPLEPIPAPQAPRMSTVARQGKQGVVTAEIGPLSKKYLVHSAFLSHYSTGIQKILRNSLTWTATGMDTLPLQLPDVDPSVFDVFVDWIYTQKLPQLPGLLPATEGWDCLLMVQCFDFSIEYGAAAFGEAVNNAFVDTVFTKGLNPHYDTIMFAYDNIVDSELPLMRLLVDFQVTKFGQHDCFAMDGSVAERMPVAFWVKMMERYARVRNDHFVDGGMELQGLYHTHRGDEEREACEVCVRLREGSEEGYDSEMDYDSEAGYDRQMGYGDEEETDEDDEEYNPAPPPNAI